MTERRMWCPAERRMWCPAERRMQCPAKRRMWCPVGVCLAVLRHLGACRGLEELVDIGVMQLPVAGDVPAVVATELVFSFNFHYHMPIATNVGILDEKIAATRLAVGLLHRGNVVPQGGQARCMADLLQGIQDRLMGVLRASSVLPVGVDVIIVRVDDVPMARADRWWMRLAISLA